MTILKGHTSQETALIVNDYPYGFRLRCKIRYWLEYKKNKGVRFVSQTTNPKLDFEKWNSPKASTYSQFGGAMYLDENNHVQWSGLTAYGNYAEAVAWKETYGEGAPEEAKGTLDKWIEAKMNYENRLRIGGQNNGD